MTRRPIYRVSQAFLRGFAHLAFGYTAEGVEHLPREGAVLLAANHTSYLDPPLLGACLPREMRYFAKKQLFEILGFGALIRSYGAVPVDRDASDRRGLQVALQILRSGEGLMIFPEGHRIRRPGLARPKDGVGLLALSTSTPVVPAYIQGTWEPRRTPVRRLPVRIRLGPALHFEVPGSPAARRKAYGAAAARVMSEIGRLGVELGALDPSQVPETPAEPGGSVKAPAAGEAGPPPAPGSP